MAQAQRSLRAGAKASAPFSIRANDAAGEHADACLAMFPRRDSALGGNETPDTTTGNTQQPVGTTTLVGLGFDALYAEFCAGKLRLPTTNVPTRGRTTAPVPKQADQTTERKPSPFSPDCLDGDDCEFCGEWGYDHRKAAQPAQQSSAPSTPGSSSADESGSICSASSAEAAIFTPSSMAGNFCACQECNDAADLSAGMQISLCATTFHARLIEVSRRCESLQHHQRNLAMLALLLARKETEVAVHYETYMRYCLGAQKVRGRVAHRSVLDRLEKRYSNSLQDKLELVRLRDRCDRRYQRSIAGCAAEIAEFEECVDEYRAELSWAVVACCEQR